MIFVRNSLNFVPRNDDLLSFLRQFIILFFYIIILYILLAEILESLTKTNLHGGVIFTKTIIDTQIGI